MILLGLQPRKEQMNKNIKLTIVSMLALTGVLAGCSIESEPTNITQVKHIEVDVDSRTVDCLVFQYSNQGGLSCDWGRTSQS